MDDVMNPIKEGQSWILLWDMTSIHASEATLAAMKVAFPLVVLCFLSRSPVTLPCSAASRATSRRRRAPLLPAPSSMAPSKAESRTKHGGISLRPNGQLAQSRTSATRTRSGARGGVNYAHRATPNSARLLKRPTSCTPLARYSRDRRRRPCSTYRLSRS